MREKQFSACTPPLFIGPERRSKDLNFYFVLWKVKRKEGRLNQRNTLAEYTKITLCTAFKLACLTFVVGGRCSPRVHCRSEDEDRKAFAFVELVLERALQAAAAP